MTDSMFRAAREGNVDELHAALTVNHSKINARNENGWTPLHVSTRYGHLEAVKFLLKEGADKEARTGRRDGGAGWTPLHEAASQGHLVIVQTLVDAGVELDSPDKDGWTPLLRSAQNGHTDVVELLLDSGADKHLRNNSGWTPLHGAASGGHVGCIKALLEKSADVNSGETWGRTPLHLASKNGHVNAAMLLIECGATVDSLSSRRQSPLHVAALHNGIAVVKLLLENGSSANARDDNGQTAYDLARTPECRAILRQAASGRSISPVAKIQQRNTRQPVRRRGGKSGSELFDACRAGDLERTVSFLLQGANVDGVDEKGWKPLLYAVKSGSVDLVKVLVEQYGASVNGTPGQKDWSPLHEAAAHGRTAIVNVLVSNGANVAVVDREGWTPLHRVAREGHVGPTRKLLEHGADPNARNDGEWAPLHEAALGGHVAVAEELLNNGALVVVRNRDEWTPLHHAAQGGHLDFVKLLVARGADVDSKNKDGWTPLHEATASGHTLVVDHLLANKSTVDVKTNAGYTSLRIAAFGGHLSIAERLLKAGASVESRDGSGHTPIEAARTEAMRALLTGPLAKQTGATQGWASVVAGTSKWAAGPPVVGKEEKKTPASLELPEKDIPVGFGLSDNSPDQFIESLKEQLAQLRTRLSEGETTSLQQMAELRSAILKVETESNSLIPDLNTALSILQRTDFRTIDDPTLECIGEILLSQIGNISTAASNLGVQLPTTQPCNVCSETPIEVLSAPSGLMSVCQSCGNDMKACPSCSKWSRSVIKLPIESKERPPFAPGPPSSAGSGALADLTSPMMQLNETTGAGRLFGLEQQPAVGRVGSQSKGFGSPFMGFGRTDSVSSGVSSGHIGSGIIGSGALGTMGSKSTEFDPMPLSPPPPVGSDVFGGQDPELPTQYNSFFSNF